MVAIRKNEVFFLNYHIQILNRIILNIVLIRKFNFIKIITYIIILKIY